MALRASQLTTDVAVGSSGSSELEAVSPMSFEALAYKALESGNVETLSRVLELIKDRERDAGIAAFHAATAAVRGVLGPVYKGSTVDHATRSGVNRTFKWATLGELAKALKDPLAANGLDYFWTTERRESGDWEVCELVHISGNSRTSSFPIDMEPSAKGMTKAMLRKGATTTARRGALEGVLGLATTDELAPEDTLSGDPITAAQLVTLEEHIETWVTEERDAEAVRTQLLHTLELASLEELDSSRYSEALRLVSK